MSFRSSFCGRGDRRGPHSSDDRTDGGVDSPQPIETRPPWRRHGCRRSPQSADETGLDHAERIWSDAFHRLW